MAVIEPDATAAINFIPRPYITKILIENGSSSEDSTSTSGKTGNFVDLYIEKENPTSDPNTSERPKINLKVTIDLALKVLYPVTKSNPSEAQALGKLTKTLQSSFFVYKPVHKEEDLVNFLLSENKYFHFMNSIPGPPLGHSMDSTIATSDISKFAYYDQSNRPIINIPTRVNHFIKTNPGQNDNPTFLAYIFMYNSSHAGPGVFTNAFAAEILFRNSAIPEQTTYFTIGDTYSHMGKEVGIDPGDKPSSDNSLSPVIPKNKNQEVLLNYGSPGMLWRGYVHRHLANGTYRYMAESVHSKRPHPYLNINYKDNDKIIDFRTTNKLENLYTYNSSKFESFLDQLSQTLYKGNPNFKMALDEYNKNPAIVSEVDYSIFENKINVWFAIDKLKLLKENSALAPLLDRLAAINPAFMDKFVEELEIFNFEISRVNKMTGEKTPLLAFDNDNYADDSNAPLDFLGKSTSKGHIFRRLDNLDLETDSKFINYYEFRDGEIQAGQYNNNEYTYSISMKFIDPIVSYVLDRLLAVRSVIKDLDELLHRIGLKIEDPAMAPFVKNYDSIYDPRVSYQTLGNMVDIYSRYSNKLNPIFVQKALNEENYFSFEVSENELPASIEENFPLLTFFGLENLAIPMLSLNYNMNLEAMESHSFDFSISEVIGFVRSSVKISTTNPTLLEHARSLMAVLEDKLFKIISLYGTSFEGKEKMGYKYEDYIKSQGQVSSKKDSLQVIHYQKTFNKTIELRETKDHFNWLAGIDEQKFFADKYNLKTVVNIDYLSAQKSNLSFLLKDEEVDGFANKMGASYLPYVDKRSLEIFNLPNQFTPESPFSLDFMLKNYQTMRNKVLGAHSSKLEHVSIPEVLSYFGIRFATRMEPFATGRSVSEGGTKNDAIDTLWLDSSATGVKRFDEDFFEDNFAQPFQPLAGADIPQDPPAYDPMKGPIYYSGGPLSLLPAYAGLGLGSVADEKYMWQGTSFKNYPYNVARSIINLIFSDNTRNYRDLDLFKVSKLAQVEGVADVNWDNVNRPPTVNLLRQLANGVMSTGQTNEVFFAQMFDELGKLNISNYQLYILFLNLFGKVYYFNGFEEGAETEKLTPTSFMVRNQIKSKVWLPLTKDKINSIGANQVLYCKVEPYLDGKYTDMKFLDLFKQYYQYNNYFYISSQGVPIFTSNLPLPFNPKDFTTPYLEETPMFDPLPGDQNTGIRLDPRSSESDSGISGLYVGNPLVTGMAIPKPNPRALSVVKNPLLPIEGDDDSEGSKGLAY